MTNSDVSDIKTSKEYFQVFHRFWIIEGRSKHDMNGRFHLKKKKKKKKPKTKFKAKKLIDLTSDFESLVVEAHRRDDHFCNTIVSPKTPQDIERISLI